MHLFGLPIVHQHYIEGEEERRKGEREVCVYAMCIYTLCTNAGNGRESQPVKDGANTSTVSTAPVDMEAGGQQDAILDRYRAVGEGGNQQFIPPCKRREETLWGNQSHACLVGSQQRMDYHPK